MPHLTSERGSVAPMFVAILVIVLTLIIAVVDREWVNYMLKLAEQTADFAAEAGASPESRDIKATVTTTRRQKHLETYCARWEQDICVETGTDVVWEHQELTRTRPITDFEEDWREIFGCSPTDSAWRPAWKCDPPKVDAYDITFNAQSTTRAEQTLRRNWKDRPRAHLMGDDVVQTIKTHHLSAYDVDTAQVTVYAHVELRSLFFVLKPWPVTVKGASTVRFEPLRLR
ncbi:MAG TPA: hypothetical protein VD902_22120 [Symbiobacteriaceae bacterium]|nr:hypothetical protein [Symbiobacteriaceae bacterium]